MGSAVEDAFVVDDRSTTILVVEDESLIRAGVSGALRDRGYTVIEAANFDEAIAVLRSSTSVDLVLTDMRMPGLMNGTHLVHLIRAQFPSLKIVMVSGQTPEADVRRLLDGFLSKPLAPTEIASYIQTLAKPEMNWARSVA